jgi:hypothetical protein
MTSAGPIPIIAALGIQPTYSARQAAVLLGISPLGRSRQQDNGS